MTNAIDYWYQKYLQEKKRADNLQSASKGKGNRIYFNPHTDTFEVKEVDLDFEQELYKAFGQVKDFTLGMRIAKHFYKLGLNAKKGE